MLISLERTGGVAGLTMAASVDTATLPAEEATSWESMVSQLDWSALRRAAPPAPGARDLFEYELTVRLPSGVVEQATLTQPGLTPPARQLIETLMARAAPC
jgi:hypothetical protein